MNKWHYTMSAPTPGNSSEEEGGPNLSNQDGGTAMEEDIVSPPNHPTQHENEPSNDYQDRWDAIGDPRHEGRENKIRCGLG